MWAWPAKNLCYHTVERLIHLPAFMMSVMYVLSTVLTSVNREK